MASAYPKGFIGNTNKAPGLQVKFSLHNRSGEPARECRRGPNTICHSNGARFVTSF